MGDLAEPVANALACAFMGWPDTLHEPLREWTRKNHEATRAMDREAMSHVAMEFDGYIREQLDLRRAARAAGAEAPDDVTTALLRDSVEGRPVTDAEIVSIVRNWTVGELGTIAASIGIIVEFLARRPDVVQLLRDDPGAIRAATDEILRIHAPLVANRRRSTRPVTIGGRDIPRRRTSHRAVGLGQPRRTRLRRPRRVPARSRPQRQPALRPGHPRLPGRSACAARAPGDHGRAVRRNGEHRARSQRAEHERDLPGVGVRVAVAAVPVGSGTGRPMASLEVPSRNDGGMEVCSGSVGLPTVTAS